MTFPRVSRRRLIGAGATVGASALLAACAGAPAPTATPASKAPEPTKPAEAAKPTEAPKPTAAAAAAPTPAPAATKPAEATKPAAAEATKPAAETKPAAAAGPASGRVIITMGQQPDTLMPRIGSMMARTEVLGAVHVDLVTSDEKGDWVAMAAEQVPTFQNGLAKWVGDGDDKHLEVSFKVKKGFKWHDGTAVTAKDMKFWWETIMNPKFKVDDRSSEVKINDVKVVDDATATFVYHSAKQARDVAAKGFKGLPAEDFADWKDQKDPIAEPLYMINSGMWPEHILGKVPAEQIESHEFTRKPVLAGPYKFKEWVPDQTITLEAVPDYALGAPKIQTVVYRIIKDTNAQLAALKAGEVDVVTQVQGPDLDKAPELDALSSAGYKTFYIPGTPWEHFDFNLDNVHLKEKAVRQAIAYGIDREQIVQRILHGKSKVALSWVQPGLPPWAWNESVLPKYAYDLNKAKALLSEAGYTAGPDGIMTKGGQKLSLKLSTTDAALRKNVGQVVQQMLKQAGIDIQLDFLPGRGLFENNGPLRMRTFDIGLYTWLSQMNPDRMDYMHSRNIPSEKNNRTGNNYMGYSNPKADELASKGASIIDEKDRAPIYHELQKIVMEDLPFLPLFQRVVVTVGRTKLQNFKPTPTSTPETWNIHEWSMA
ncbi:MAG TPA: ABC transporter substrate-binding protein [Chloroflexota bacterium]